MNLKTNRHSVYSLQYHLVVVTKYRKSVINESIKNELILIAKNIFEVKNKAQILEINTDKDHIHILFNVGSQIQLSKLINSFKTVSSRLVRKKFSSYLSRFYWKLYFWDNSYYIASVGDANEDTVKKIYTKSRQIKKLLTPPNAVA